MKEKTKAYVGGLIDAEGSVYIAKCPVRNGSTTAYNPEACLSSNHLPTLKWVVHHFGGRIYETDTRPGQMNWHFSSQKHAARFLRLVLPYILLKRKEAETVIKYCDLNGMPDVGARERLYALSQALKERQRSVTTITQDFLNWKLNLRHAYLSGLIDGDGWISISKNPQKRSRGFFYTKTIALAQKETNGLCVRLLSRTFGGNTFYRHARNGSKPQVMWFLQKGEEQEKCLLALLPYLIEKRERAQALLKMIRLGREQNVAVRDQIWRRMKVLNRKKDRV